MWRNAEPWQITPQSWGGRRAAARTGDFGIRQPKEGGAPEQNDQPEAKRRERRRVALSGAPERKP